MTLTLNDLETIQSIQTVRDWILEDYPDIKALLSGSRDALLELGGPNDEVVDLALALRHLQKVLGELSIDADDFVATRIGNPCVFIPRDAGGGAA